MTSRLVPKLFPLAVSSLLFSFASSVVLAQEPTPPPPVEVDVPTNDGRTPPEGCWFEKIHIGFGKKTESTEAMRLKGEYKFENKSGSDQEITVLSSSCKCQELKLIVNGKEQAIERKLDVEQSLKKPIKVPAGAKGSLELVFDVSGGAGQRSGHIRVDTTDPKMPTFNLTCDATVDPAFVVEPGEVFLGKMAPVEAREWTVKVRCMLEGDWELEAKPLEPVALGMKVKSVERGKDERGDYVEIKGQYGPDLEEGAIGGNLLFKTDRDGRNVMVSVRAEVQAKVVLTPGFFTLNRFQRAKGAERTVYIWPTDLENDDLDVERIEIVSSNFKGDGVQFNIVAPPALDPQKGPQEVQIPRREQAVPAHKLWRIEVVAKPGIELQSGRRLSVMAKVHFRGAGMVPKSFRFNGFPFPIR